MSPSSLSYSEDSKGRGPADEAEKWVFGGRAQEVCQAFLPDRVGQECPTYLEPSKEVN